MMYNLEMSVPPFSLGAKGLVNSILKTIVQNLPTEIINT